MSNRKTEPPRGTPHVTDTKTIALYHGDSLHVLRQFADRSIDLIVTSPPYADARKKTYGGIPHAEYVEWLLPIGAELLRVLEPDGSFVLNIKESVVKGERHSYVSDLIRALREQGWKLIEEYVWVKPNPYPGWWPTRLRDAFERCFHLSPTTRCFMDQDAVKVPIGDWVTKWNPAKARTDLRKRGTRSNFWTRDKNWAGKTHVLPTNVLQFPTENKNKKHPAVFPRQLPEFFVRLLSEAGDVVLDPFAGSGTTLSVAAALGRRAIGIELKDEYVVNMEAEFGIVREPPPVMLSPHAPANDTETLTAEGRAS